MSRAFQKRLRRLEEVKPDGEPRGVPTPAELWRYRLVEAVDTAVKYPKGGALQAHLELLQTREQICAAPDSLLLEALGLSDVHDWGWLQFMVRDLTWFCMLAKNWNLPHMLFLDAHTGDTLEIERRVYAARQFRDMTRRQHDFDPLDALRAAAEVHKEKYELSEAEFIELLRVKHGWWHYVYISESTVIRPVVLRDHNARNQVEYQGEWRGQFLAEIRAASAGVVFA